MWGASGGRGVFFGAFRGGGPFLGGNQFLTEKFRTTKMERDFQKIVPQTSPNAKKKKKKTCFFLGRAFPKSKGHFKKKTLGGGHFAKKKGGGGGAWDFFPAKRGIFSFFPQRKNFRFPPTKGGGNCLPNKTISFGSYFQFSFRPDGFFLGQKKFGGIFSQTRSPMAGFPTFPGLFPAKKKHFLPPQPGLGGPRSIPF